MNRTKIDWGIPNLKTWNPITGCKRGCWYCYARRIYERFNETKFSEIIFHENRLLEPKKVKKPAVIFVGSMSDIEYWEPEYTDIILNVCHKCPQHTFMFLSKNPLSYAGFDWPRNCMCGLTIDTDKGSQARNWIIFSGIKARKFLSIEPLLEAPARIPDYLELVIVGAMTGPGAISPEKKWIEKIEQIVPAEKLHWKNNIKDLVKKCTK